MPYNPCGYAIDIATHDYETDCRFFKDSDHVSKIRWVDAGDLPPFPGTSGIVNLNYENDNALYQDPLGEVWGAARPYKFGRLPLGVGDHYCGTLEDFQNGAHYDPDIDPIPYGASGWPLCCGPAVVVAGGAGAGGYATVGGSQIYPTYGGFTFGGSIVPRIRQLFSPYGGFTFGGSIVPRIRQLVAPLGGFTFGGSILPQYTVRVPTSGGFTFGGSILPRYLLPVSPSGGFTFGGSILPQYTVRVPTSGGFTFGGSIVPDMAGSINTTNLTGGPVPMSGNITFDGEGNVQLSVVGTVIKFTGLAPPPAPSPPTLTSAGGGNGTVALAWTGGALDATYTVYYSTSATLSGATAITGITGTSYTVTGLATPQTYYFSVVGVSSSGVNSAYSNVLSAATSTGTRQNPSNTTSNGTTYYGAPGLASDNNTSTYYQVANPSGTYPVYLVLTFSAAIKCILYKMSPAVGGGYNDPSSWTFQGSNDNSTWTTLDTQSGITASFWTGIGSGYASFTPATSPTAAYLYYRLAITALDAGANCGLAEFQVWA